MQTSLAITSKAFEHFSWIMRSVTPSVYQHYSVLQSHSQPHPPQGSHCRALAGLELTVESSLALDSQAPAGLPGLGPECGD